MDIVSLAFIPLLQPHGLNCATLLILRGSSKKSLATASNAGPSSAGQAHNLPAQRQTPTGHENEFQTKKPLRRQYHVNNKECGCLPHLRG